MVRYVDIHQPEGDKEAAFSRRVIEEDLWYPVVVIEDEIVAEGNPKLKEICRVLEERGVVAMNR
jgi:disulfide oxidoreductase YuzD